MAKQRFALRERVIVPDTNGSVQGVIVSRTDSVTGPTVCVVAYLTDAGKSMICDFTVPQLVAGMTKMPEAPARKVVRHRKTKR